MIYITTATTTTIADNAAGIAIQVNGPLTGTITVKDGGTTVAIITNPGVGAYFKYYGFKGQVTIVTNASCDVTVSVLSRESG